MKQRKSKVRLFFAAIAITLVGTVLAGCGESGMKYAKITDKSFLSANGKELVDKKGNTVVLRGVNAGGYLLQEFWMTPTRATEHVHAQQDIIDVLTERFGKEKAEELIDAYETAYWTEEDFKNCAEMGMNVIRLPFWWRNLAEADGSLKEDAFDRIDWFVDTAGRYGLYVILDMHGAPGSQSGSDHSGVDGQNNKQEASGFWFGDKAEANQELFYSLWEEVAKHYNGNPIVAGYDILNEPFCTYRYNMSISDKEIHTMLWDVYDKAYDTIRSVDEDHIIVMEAVWDPSDLPKPSLYGWENVMYEYHNYLYDDYYNVGGKQISNMSKKLALITAANYDVPSYMGEFNYFESFDAWDEGLTMLNDYGISWTTWSYKTVEAYGNWGLYNHDISMNKGAHLEKESYDTILNQWSKVGTAECKINQKLVDVMKKALQ